VSLVVCFLGRTGRPQVVEESILPNADGGLLIRVGQRCSRGQLPGPNITLILSRDQQRLWT
jgi:hypothetical protein